MYRVLIADDEMIERTVLFRTLDKNLKGQCEIFQAENGRKALEIYEKERIQILILDIEMPGINGIEAAERIREKDKECSIIFLTAFDEFSYAKKAIMVRALAWAESLKPEADSYGPGRNRVGGTGEDSLRIPGFRVRMRSPAMCGWTG